MPLACCPKTTLEVWWWLRGFRRASSTVLVQFNSLCVCVCLCVCGCVCVGAWVRGCVGAWVHGCVRGAWVCGCMGVCVCVCVCACVCVCVCACVCVCVCVCVEARKSSTGKAERTCTAQRSFFFVQRTQMTGRRMVRADGASANDPRFRAVRHSEAHHRRPLRFPLSTRTFSAGGVSWTRFSPLSQIDPVTCGGSLSAVGAAASDTFEKHRAAGRGYNTHVMGLHGAHYVTPQQHGTRAHRPQCSRGPSGPSV